MDEDEEGVYALCVDTPVTQHLSVTIPKLEKRKTGNAGTVEKKGIDNGTVQRSVRASGEDVDAPSVDASAMPLSSVTLLQLNKRADSAGSVEQKGMDNGTVRRSVRASHSRARHINAVETRSLASSRKRGEQEGEIGEGSTLR